MHGQFKARNLKKNEHFNTEMLHYYKIHVLHVRGHILESFSFNCMSQQVLLATVKLIVVKREN